MSTSGIRHALQRRKCVTSLWRSRCAKTAARSGSKTIRGAFCKTEARMPAPGMMINTGSRAIPTAAPIIPNNWRASSALESRQSSDLSSSSDRKDVSFNPPGTATKTIMTRKAMMEARMGASREKGRLPFSIASLIFFSVASSVLLSLSAPSDIGYLRFTMRALPLRA